MARQGSVLFLIVCAMEQLATATGHRHHAQRFSGDMPQPAAVQGHHIRGSCWLRVEANGRCVGLYSQNVTRAECCATELGPSSVSHALGWTPYEEITSRQYFYWVIMGHGAPDCQPCRTSCENFLCGSHKVCRLRHGQPRCVCSPECSASMSRASTSISGGQGRMSGTIRSTSLYSAGSISNAGSGSTGGPVCAFDGRTYRSQCALSRFNCRFNKELHVEYSGRCQNSCSNVSCPTGKHCVHDQNGVPHCIFCAADCPNISSSSERVCGGDGRTYQSLCHLEKEVCVTGQSIRLAYRGECQAGLTCATLQCASHERCLMNEETQTPVCVVCDRPCSSAAAASAGGSGVLTSVVGNGYDLYARRTVCATNGITYGSFCDMWRVACDHRVLIEARHAGSCGSAAGVGRVLIDDYADGESPGGDLVE